MLHRHAQIFVSSDRGSEALLNICAGYSSVKRRMYSGMQHSSCPEELNDIKRFILDAVPDAPPPAKSRCNHSLRCWDFSVKGMQLKRPWPPFWSCFTADMLL